MQYAEGQCPGCMAGIVAEDRAQSADLKTLGMQCFPLYSLLLAAAGQGVTVNYLSLDIEGAEFLVRSKNTIYVNYKFCILPGSTNYPLG